FPCAAGHYTALGRTYRQQSFTKSFLIGWRNVRKKRSFLFWKERNRANLSEQPPAVTCTTIRGQAASTGYSANLFIISGGKKMKKMNLQLFAEPAPEAGVVGRYLHP